MDEMNILPDGTQETNIPELSRQKTAQQKKGGIAKRICALALSAVLFGAAFCRKKPAALPPATQLPPKAC